MTPVIAAADSTTLPSSQEQRPLVVLQLCFSKSWGGLEMHPSQLSAALVKHGCQVHAACLEGTRVAESFQTLGLPILTSRSLNRALVSVRHILRYIRQHQITILHAHKSGDMRLAALLVQLAPDLKLFFTDHMGVSISKKDGFHRWTYSKVTRLFSISKATHAVNLSAFPLPPDRITQLYNGIDLTPYQHLASPLEKRQSRQSLNVPLDGVLLGIPGRIDPGKGHMQWVEALAALAKQTTHSDWHAVIIGEASGSDAHKGGFKDQLRVRIQSHGIQDRITFAGFRSDMPKCLQALDIAVIPSQHEAFGLSVIESMAAGCAVIGANSGAIPELINEETGLLVDPNDSEAFAASFVRLIGDEPSRCTMGERAHAHAFKHFGMDTYVNKLLNYYQETSKPF